MNTAGQKQAGDLVTITAGVNKGQEGVLQEKVSNGWNIKLRSGEVVLTSFPFVKLIAKQRKFEENPQSEQPQENEPMPEAESEIEVECEIVQNPPENQCSASEETDEEITIPGENISQAPSSAPASKGSEEGTEIPENIAKMTTVQLRDLAKQKGVSVARTKADFLRIIKEKNPDEDLERLKGKVLFDRVSELHISRLRSKEDLQKLLAQ